MAYNEEEWQTPYTRELYSRRMGLGLSIRAAVTRAGFGSHTRWTQVERGYQYVKGQKIATEPGVDFVINAAKALKWDIREALETAGFDPDSVHIPDPAEDRPPRTLEDLWVKLNDQQRAALYNLARIMVDPEAIVDPVPHTQETGKRPVPRVVFSAEDNTKNTGR